MSRSAFRLRSLASLSLLFSFLLSLLSGIALYLRPEGALARWLNWSWLGYDKKSWELIHIGVVLLLLISGLVHLILNGKALLGYLYKRRASVTRHGFEIAFALILTALFALGTLYKLPPFSALAQLRSVIKNGQNQSLPQPPLADAEKLSIPQLAQIMETDAAILLARLRHHHLTLPWPDASLLEIAKANGLGPAELYVVLQSESTHLL